MTCEKCMESDCKTIRRKSAFMIGEIFQSVDALSTVKNL